MARDVPLDSLGTLLNQRLYSIKSQAERFCFVKLSKDGLNRASLLEGSLEQYAKCITIDLQLTGGLIHCHLKNLFEFLIGQISGLDKKLGNRCIAGSDRCCLHRATRRRRRTGKLRWRHRLPAHQGNGSGLGAFPENINQAAKKISPKCHQFCIRIIGLRVALEGKEQEFLIGKNALGISRERRLIDVAGKLLRACANSSQSI